MSESTTDQVDRRRSIGECITSPPHKLLQAKCTARRVLWLAISLRPSVKYRVRHRWQRHAAKSWGMCQNHCFYTDIHTSRTHEHPLSLHVSQISAQHSQTNNNQQAYEHRIGTVQWLFSTVQEKNRKIDKIRSHVCWTKRVNYDIFCILEAGWSPFWNRNATVWNKHPIRNFTILSFSYNVI